ncbi:MAG: hypothetical protein ACK5AN_12315, partial [Planctomyces sp.]
MTLGRRELEALQDGFSQITIGRQNPGNEMFLGDAMPEPKAKGLGLVPLGIDSTIKDNLLLMTDSFVVQGDFRVPADILQVNARVAKIDKTNLHTPNSGPDSGLSAKDLNLIIGERFDHLGWLVGTDAVVISVMQTPMLPALSEAPVSVETVVGSRIETTADGSSIEIQTNQKILIAGSVEVFGVGSRAVLQAGTNATVLQGGTIAGRGDDILLTLSAEQIVTLNPGGAVIAGARFDEVNGAPVAVQTGSNAQAVLNSSGELAVKGTVTTSGEMQLNSGTPQFDHSDYFTSRGDLDPKHPLLGHSQYGILLTGTLTTLAAGSELTLSSPADVIIMGNINVLG